jgi:hypothetical protein
MAIFKTLAHDDANKDVICCPRFPNRAAQTALVPFPVKCSLINVDNLF